MGLFTWLMVALPVAFVVLLVLWFIRMQNSLVRADELCGNAMSQIGVQQATRWDALTALADLCKGYSDQEYNVLMETISARKNTRSGTPVSEVQHQEDMLAQGFARINALAEAYPDLKSNVVYMKTMDSVRELENNVRMSRMVFNDTVTKYNRLVREFPGSLAASMLRFVLREYLQEDPGKGEMPNMKR
ncbi:MAG: LemA family protein [Peptococcaceae bacterium]|jgi:LemA protein|nr:LemA family protein [Peptococcaceae bacterium]